MRIDEQNPYTSRGIPVASFSRKQRGIGKTEEYIPVGMDLTFFTPACRWTILLVPQFQRPRILISLTSDVVLDQHS